jgi:UDP-N-acetylmuramoyl-tripeptide--D-alanyl-D-alanine ligase
LKSIPVEEFAKLAGGEARGFAPGAAISGFATDNREARAGDLFLAIKGERVDGHEFAGDAVVRGAVGTLAERDVPGPHIVVPNLVAALAQMASHFRGAFHGPVVGVTGSAGKTTVKEFIAAALSPLGPILKTEGNRNTEYTVPLVWAELGDRLEACATKAVVVEMSMRGLGQIRHLASFSKPTIGVITNIGYSHMSEVGSREAIAEAKAELLEALPKDGVAVLWADDAYADFLRHKSPCRVVTFGFSGGVNPDCAIHHYAAKSWTSCEIAGVIDGEEWHAEPHAVGRHIALAAAAAVAVGRSAGVPPAQAAEALQTAQLPPMRMEVVELNGAKVLLDTYNAAPPSMLAAIETFTELPCEGRRLAVIGEMRELGTYTDEAHRELGRVLAGSGIDEVIFFGGPTVLSAEEARMRGMVVHLGDSLTEVAGFLKKAGKDDAVLVKGSRSLELEKAVALARQPMGAGC